MKTIAIITARGGSKRIPRKNIRNFNGKPIIAYSIEAAVSSRIFDTVMVSTDDEEIAKISQEYGAEVPFYRSPATSNDYATTRDVLLEVLHEYEKRNDIFDYMACLYPTNPFVNQSMLKSAMQSMIDGGYEGIIPVVKFSYPPQRAFVISEDGCLRYKWDEFIDSRSQDLESFYHDAGQFYFYDVKAYLKNNGVIKGKIHPIILSEAEVQDIDTLKDWEMAEFKYIYLNQKSSGTI